jgi:hypothetical protein
MTLHAKMARPNCENCCFAGENDFWPAISVIQTASSDSKFVNFLNSVYFSLRDAIYIKPNVSTTVTLT